MPDLTLVEKLRQIADAKKGDPMPECLGAPSTFAGVAKDPKSGVSVGLGSSDWATPLSAICKEAADRIEELQLLHRNALKHWGAAENDVKRLEAALANANMPRAR